MAAFGRDFQLTDVGDTFEKAASAARYVDERLQAAATDAPLPSPPRIYADLVSVKIGFATTLVYEVLMVAIVLFVSGRSPRELARVFHMTRYAFDDLWRPGLAVVVAYVGVVLYAVAMDRLGLDALRPQSTIPDVVTRDAAALIMAGLLACFAAPFAEELLFRGLIFTGLLRWGFLPAAAVSAVLFDFAHLDPGSFIPFFFVGLIMAWLYWSKGTLWDSIAFHFLFNGLSYLFLLIRLASGE